MFYVDLIETLLVDSDDVRREQQRDKNIRKVCECLLKGEQMRSKKT